MTAQPEPPDDAKPVRGVWVAVAMIVGVAVVFGVLVLTSGVLGG